MRTKWQVESVLAFKSQCRGIFPRNVSNEQKNTQYLYAIVFHFQYKVLKDIFLTNVIGLALMSWCMWKYFETLEVIVIQ